MVTVGTDTLGIGQTKVYGFDVNDYLSVPGGGTATISGTPTVNGINCTVTYITNSAGVVTVKAVAAAGLGAGAKGEVQLTTTLSNGEVIPAKIDLTFE